jgi:hypothetical protein
MHARCVARERRRDVTGALLWMALVVAWQNVPAQTPRSQSLDAPAARAAAAVFESFEKARSEYDVPRVGALEAPDYVWVEFTGERRSRSPIHLENIVEWERVMGTKWECRILGYDNGELEVEMKEHNHLYDVLGVGAAVREQRERVEGGLVHEERVVGLRFTGRTQDEAMADFEHWLQGLPAARQEGVMHNGHLMLTGESAPKELPLLEEWSQTRVRKSSSSQPPATQSPPTGPGLRLCADG